jgi:hypothetical protein
MYPQGFGWLNLTANGNVRPSRVVVGVNGSGNALLAVEASTAGTLPPLGITTEKTRFPAGDPADDGYHAIALEPLTIATPGQRVPAVAGAAISDARSPLTYDNQGRVVTAAPAAGTKVWCIGWPTYTVGTAGEKVEVLVTTPFVWSEPV